MDEWKLRELKLININWPKEKKKDNNKLHYLTAAWPAQSIVGQCGDRRHDLSVDGAENGGLLLLAL